MRRVLRGFVGLITVLSLAAVVPGPAEAAIASTAQNSGGVLGLATGSRSDAIRTNVWAIEQIGNTIYVGGKFTAVSDNGGQTPRSYLAAFRADTGAWISSWQPQVNNSVNALQASPDGSSLFIGGDFTTVNGTSIPYFAALDPTTGANQGFVGRITSGSSVRGFDVQDGWLYVAGTFSGVSSNQSNTGVGGTARFSLSSQAHDPNWAPMITGGGTWAVAASPDADRVYFAGYFDTVNGANRPGGFAAVTASSGANIAGLAPFITNTTRDYAQDVAVANGLVWVGGSEHYVYVMNESDLGLRVFHLSTLRGDFQDLEVVGDRVYAGCHCWANSILYTRHDGVIPYPPTANDLAQADSSAPNTWIVGFDALTGEHIQSFKPNIRSTGPGVWAIHGAPDGCLWIGGTIHKANEQPVDNLVRLCDETYGEPGEPADTQRPSVPGSANVSGAGTGYVDLAWNPSTDNIGVAGYRIYDAATSQPMFDSPTNSARFSAPAGAYQLYLRSFDSAGNLSWRSGSRTVVISNGSSSDTTRPDVPGSIEIVASGDGFHDLSWRASTDDTAVTGYRLYDINSGAVLADVAGNATRLSLPPGSYSVYVRAYDAAGNQSWRSGTRSLNF